MDRTVAVVLLAVHGIVMAVCAAMGGLWTAAWTAVLLYALYDPTSPAVIDWFFGIGVAMRAFLLLPTLVAALLTGASATSLRRGERRFVLATILSAIVVPLVNLTVSLMTFDLLGFAWLVSWVVGIVASIVVVASLQGTQGRDDEW